VLRVHRTEWCVQPVCEPNWTGGLQWKFYFVYIAVLVIECLVIYFFYVETKGPTLEEITILFDGENSHVGTTLPMPEKKTSASTVERVREV
jgi:hypothetical protein